MGRLRPLLRLSAVFLLFLVVVGLDACDDDREPIVGPNARMLDGDDIYAITLISAGILRFQNVVADTALRFLALTSDTTVTFVGDTPTGTMTMQLTGDGIGGGPDTAIVMFTNFRDTTSVSVADFIDGALQYVFTQTENGLEYEMNPSDVNLVPLGLAQFAVQYTLTNELENMVLLAAGAIHSEMQAGAGSAQSGDVWQTGSFRIEDRDQRHLVRVRRERAPRFRGLAGRVARVRRLYRRRDVAALRRDVRRSRRSGVLLPGHLVRHRPHRP